MRDCDCDDDDDDTFALEISMTDKKQTLEGHFSSFEQALLEF